MVKKIPIKSPKNKPKSGEEWVSNREGMKRLTFDVPLSLHASLKIASVKDGRTMGELVRDCLQQYLEQKNLK